MTLLEDHDDITSEGLINVIGALFRLTSQDIRMGSQEAKEFIESDWFESICNGLQLSPQKVKILILNNTVKSRVSYE